jgi:hypothetical protein
LLRVDQYQDLLARAHQLYVCMAKAEDVLVKGGHKEDAKKFLTTVARAQAVETEITSRCIDAGLTPEQIREALARKFEG